MLPDEVVVVGVEGRRGEQLLVHVELAGRASVVWEVWVGGDGEERPQVTLVDLPCFGRPTRLVWHKRRWRCPNRDCDIGRGPSRTRGPPPLGW